MADVKKVNILKCLVTGAFYDTEIIIGRVLYLTNSLPTTKWLPEIQDCEDWSWITSSLFINSVFVQVESQYVS
jgi:hypothetical protein